jgi:hypothetical protein
MAAIVFPPPLDEEQKVAEPAATPRTRGQPNLLRQVKYLTLCILTLLIFLTTLSWIVNYRDPREVFSIKESVKFSLSLQDIWVFSRRGYLLIYSRVRRINTVHSVLTAEVA